MFSVRKSYFITGTSTGVGKTRVATGILAGVSRLGFSTAGFKPVAAGCERTTDGLQNGDAQKLLSQTSLSLSYEQINPIALEPAIAPHIAAEEIGQRLSAARLAGFYRGLMTNSPNFSVVEGAGGWRVPINNQENFSDFAKLIKLPVILVVGMDLGCINHAILTAEAIRKDNLVLAGWIANQIVPMMNRYKENITTLQHCISSPMIGELAHNPHATPDETADQLNIKSLI